MKKLRIKKHAQIHHSIKRARQRFGVDLNEYQIREISNIISKQRKPNCIFLSNQSNRVTRWAVMYNGQIYPVIYDKIRHNIVTFLGEYMLTDEEKDVISKFKESFTASE